MSAIILFEEKQVRRAWDQADGKWYFAIADVIAVLTDSTNPAVYWRVMKKRLTDEGSETVTKCNALKMTATDGKQRLTDVADTEQLLRLIQSLPSPKDNLRDHMTDLELIFTMLGEASTTEIARKQDARGFPENKRAAKAGGTIAGNARRELEIQSGSRVSSRRNFKSLSESQTRTLRHKKPNP